MREHIAKEIVRRQDQVPFYLYDIPQQIRQMDSLRDLAKQVDIYYAVKANPHDDVIETALGHPAIKGAEIASAGEAQKILDAGELDLARVVYTGPAKTEQDLSFVMKNGIGCINLESVLEAHRISALAQRMRRTQDVLVRINTNLEMHGAAKQLTSADKPGSFGIDESSCVEAIGAIRNLAGLRVRGIHTYAATGIMSAENLLESVRYTFDLCDRIEKQTGTAFDTLDFGGGFGIDYEYETVFDVPAYAKGLQNLVVEYGMQDKHLILELGRYITADMGYFVTKIVDIKSSKGKKVVLCDAGTNAHRRPYALKINYPVSIIPMHQQPLFRGQESVHDERALVCGPLCTSADVLAPDTYIAEAHVGDLLVMAKAGAYGYTMSHTHFLSNNKTKEIIIGVR